MRWHGVWYEGMVVKLGPREKLCRVREVCHNLYQPVVEEMTFHEMHD